MKFPSLLRGLTASIGTNISALKRQAKRLHKAAPTIFDQPVTIDQCQDAIAYAIGFRGWSEVNEVGIKSGNDKNIPFWHIFSRNDAHTAILNALIETEINLNENGPVAILGKANDVASPAIGLWVESISVRNIPGLILVNTDKPTLQDTVLGSAISILELDEIFSQCRVIDARESTLPVSISATPDVWIRTLTGLLSKEDDNSFESSGARHLFEVAARHYGAISRWITDERKDIPFDIIEKAAKFLSNPKVHASHLLDFLQDPDRTGLQLDIAKYCENLPKRPIDSIRKMVDSVAERNTSLGRVLYDESLHRPTIVLFNQADIASTVIAGASHGMYYWRHVWERSIRPILYFNDTSSHSIPDFICFGTETVIANGSTSKTDQEWKPVTMGKAQFAEVKDGALSFSGRKCSFL